MAAHSIEVNAQNFDAEVLQRSHVAPVLVDFWAPWCGPCRSLTPVLEKLATEYAGKFVLAKLNTDDNQALAAEFAIRSIPNVKVVVKGEIVDEFMGALPESQVRRFLERWVPSAAEEIRRSARTLLDAGQSAAALERLEQVLALEPSNALALLDRGEALIQLERLDDARATLERLPPARQEDDRAKQLLARLDFAQRAAAVGDAAELKRTIETDPNDTQARLRLADWHVSRREFEQALELLLEVVQRDRKDGADAGRKKMIEVFSLLGNGGELVERYRRNLARALH